MRKTKSCDALLIEMGFDSHEDKNILWGFA
jgi:hypothetical protein